MLTSQLSYVTLTCYCRAHGDFHKRK